MRRRFESRQSSEGEGFAEEPDSLCPAAAARPPEDSDAALVVAVARGDREALARLYDRHAGRMVALAFRIVADAALAEDIAHDVFVEAWHHAEEYDPERGTVGGWLTLRTRSRALDRRGRLIKQTQIAEGGLANASGVTPSELDVGADLGAVRRSIVALPVELAEVIHGAYYEGLTAQALADRSGIPVGTVKSRLARAIARLRDLLIVPDRAEDSS